ncbi:substrate-binding periplasmic protein [Roseateles koreensis]|uniref:Transporter substrate-binding domain-containing protein n=1 Tax=Roseateles koreensis TaxID=2987526 RepID=A0ABT5KUQ2_9BURK|nr:transporter substrate-binding domain-containing protein [Roseateles koreensis]MDC8786083.1 transporter substrate-binding domain-containing protein [Roseateles koreensis]
MKIAHALGLLLASFALVTGAKAFPCPNKPVRLAFYQYGLLYFENASHAGQGIDKDVADELARRSGCKFQFSVQARARIWKDLESGWLDMTVSGIETPDRTQFAWFTPYLAMKNYLVLRADQAEKIHSANELLNSNLRFGVVRSFHHGSAQDAWVEKLRQENRVSESVDAKTTFLKLKTGLIDAMFSQPLVYRKYLDDLDMTGMAVALDLTPDEPELPHNLVLAKKSFSEAEASQWRGLVLEMRYDGTLRQIFRRYVSERETERLLSF